MYRTLSSQAFGFLAFFSAGVVLGAAYDVLRIWRAMFRSERRSVFFQDFIYMILAGYFTFLVNLAVNYGELRLYLFAGEALGWFAWHETVGRVTVGLFRRLFRFLYRKLFDPIGAYFRKNALKFGKKIKKSVNSAQKRFQSWKKSLKHHRTLVYNQHNGKRKVGKRETVKEGAQKHESNRGQKTEEKHSAAHRYLRFRSLCSRGADSGAGGHRRKKAGARFR